MIETEISLLKSREKFPGYIRKRIWDTALAEDILHDCLLKVVISAPAISDEVGLLRWFYRVPGNAIIDTYRRQASEMDRKVRYAAEVEPVIESHDASEICQRVNELVVMLKPDYADLVRAMDINVEEMEVVSKRLGISSNNLKVKLHRARRVPRDRMEDTCKVCAEHHCLDCDCKPRNGYPAGDSELSRVPNSSRQSVTG